VEVELPFYDAGQKDWFDSSLCRKMGGPATHHGGRKGPLLPALPVDVLPLRGKGKGARLRIFAISMPINSVPRRLLGVYQPHLLAVLRCALPSL